jgi:hypothetical protein
MSITRTVSSLAFSSLCWAGIATAAERTLSATQDKPFEFSHLLKERPLDLDQLLGRHISEVVPGQNWEALPSPEEFKNPAIKYGVFAREDLHDYMKTWDFMTDAFCISSYSMFLLFFNKGFVFKVELRLIPDSFTGAVKSTDPKYCADETPVFRMIARRLGGTIVARESASEVTKYTSKYVMTLGTGGRVTDLSWNLRGAPSSPNF